MLTLRATATRVRDMAMGGFTYKVTAICVERPDVELRFVQYCGDNKALADRLVKAIDAGAAWANASVKTDLMKQQYIGFTSKVFGRTLNADLKKLGF